jgi:hypothetical protein
VWDGPRAGTALHRGLMTATDSEQARITPTAARPAGAPADPAPVAGVSRWLDVALGAALRAEDVGTGLIADLRRAASADGRWIDELAERGAIQRARARRRAIAAARSAVTAVATSGPVDLVVDAQLERVLRPVVRAVLDDVLLLLEQEPERIQSLIRGQRESMVDEVVGRIRTGAAAGDTAVERLTTRMFRRAPAPAPVPADGT